MADVCANCKSANTQTLLDGYVCTVCGRTTRYDDGKTVAERPASRNFDLNEPLPDVEHPNGSPPGGSRLAHINGGKSAPPKNDDEPLLDHEPAGSFAATVPVGNEPIREK